MDSGNGSIGWSGILFLGKSIFGMLPSSYTFTGGLFGVVFILFSFMLYHPFDIRMWENVKNIREDFI